MSSGPVVLACAQPGAGTSSVAAAVGSTRPAVIKWRERFRAQGLAGLEDEPRPGRTKTIDDEAITAAPLEPPPATLAVTHWSSRLLGRHLGIGDATVARAWRRYHVQPWRRGMFKFSTEPELEGQGPRRGRAVPEPAGQRDRAVRGRDEPDPGAEPFARAAEQPACPDLPQYAVRRDHQSLWSSPVSSGWRAFCERTVLVSGNSIGLLDMGQGLSDRRGVDTGQALAYEGATGRAGRSAGWPASVRQSRCRRTVVSAGSIPSLVSGGGCRRRGVGSAGR